MRYNTSPTGGTTNEASLASTTASRARHTETVSCCRMRSGSDPEPLVEGRPTGPCFDRTSFLHAVGDGDGDDDDDGWRAGGRRCSSGVDVLGTGV